MTHTTFARRTVALAAVIVAGTSAAARAQGRIAYVYGDQVLRAAPGAAAADSEGAKRIKQYTAAFNKFQAQVDSAGQKFDDTSPMLTATARVTAQKNLQVLQDSLNKLNTYYQQRAQQDKQELFGQIEDRITSVIEGLRAEGNYDYVWDMTVLQQSGAVLAANKTLDLTAKVIARLKGS